MKTTIARKTPDMVLAWDASADLPDFRTPCNGVMRMAMGGVHLWPVWSLLPASLGICNASLMHLSQITASVAFVSVLSSIGLMVTGKKLTAYATLAFLRHIKRSHTFPLNALQAALVHRYEGRWNEDDLQQKKIVAKMNAMLCRWLARKHRSSEAAVASLRDLCQEMRIRMSDLLGVKASFAGDDIAQLVNTANDATLFMSDLEWIRALMAIHHINKMSNNGERIKLSRRTGSWLSKIERYGEIQKEKLDNASDFLHRDAALRLLTLDGNETTETAAIQALPLISQQKVLEA